MKNLILNLKTLKYILPWHWTYEGFKQFLRIGETILKFFFKWAAIFFIGMELIFRFVMCLTSAEPLYRYITLSGEEEFEQVMGLHGLHKPFTKYFLEEVREIIILSASIYAMKIAKWPKSQTAIDGRFCNLFFLLVIQAFYFIWLAEDEDEKGLSSLKSPLWLGSGIILCLNLLEVYENEEGQISASSTKDIEMEDFFKYCLLGKKEKLKQYVAKHRNWININDKHKGNTALHLAIEGNHLQIVLYLLQTFDKKLDFRLKNEENLTPLDLSIKKKYSIIAKALLSDKRANPDFSSLVLAVKTDQAEIARAISQVRCRIRMSNRMSELAYTKNQSHWARMWQTWGSLATTTRQTIVIYLVWVVITFAYSPPLVYFSQNATKTDLFFYALEYLTALLGVWIGVSIVHFVYSSLP